MAHRQFSDSAGNEWSVFDVTPRADDRRTQARRADAAESSDAAVGAERRQDDRRLTVGGQRPPRLTQGWLCFERQGERRRLQPIPKDWIRLSDSEMQQLLEAARVAPLRQHAAPRRRA